MERVGGMKHIDFDSNAIIPCKETSMTGKWSAKRNHTFSWAEDWVEILRGMGTSRRCSTTVICSDKRQNIAVPGMTIKPERRGRKRRDCEDIPSPHTIAATSAPRPGTQLSSTRPSATLSQPPSSFSIRTSLLTSTSNVWNAPSFTCWFSSATRPETSTIAVAAGAVFGAPLVVPDSAPGAADGAQVTRVTARVRCRRIRFESTEPVVETFCTRRMPAARTRSPYNKC